MVTMAAVQTSTALYKVRIQSTMGTGYIALQDSAESFSTHKPQPRRTRPDRFSAITPQYKVYKVESLSLQPSGLENAIHLLLLRARPSLQPF